jgi:hypothetical protein
MTREEIIDKANEREFTLTFGNLRYKALLSGKKLDYPIIYTPKALFKHEISTEISWKMAEQIANGETNNVDY